MKQFWYCWFLFALLLTGCSRYVCWVEDVFNEGQPTADYKYITQCYVRSIRVYDQFATLGLFDVLWLSDEVRTAYAKIYACKIGLSEDRYQIFVRRQLEENNHYLSFYVLGSIPSCEGKDHSILGTKDSVWSIVLFIDGKRYTPREIKTVDLTPEYMRFFGKTFTHFKTPYIVTFDAKDAFGQSLIEPGVTRSIKIVLRRMGRQECVVWTLDEQGRALCCSSWHPNVLFYDLPTLV